MIDKLYENIGGNRTIWAATESFYRRVLNDPELRPFFESVDMAKLVAGQSMFLTMLLGGKVVYTGKDIGAAHARVRDLGLTGSHFDSFLKHFRAALDEVGVKPDKAEEVIKLLQAKRSTILRQQASPAST
ncbi:MAG: group I truncated hemoglobin [Acidobacteriaceae bacterium]